MDFSFNSVEIIPDLKASAAFTVNSRRVLAAHRHAEGDQAEELRIHKKTHRNCQLFQRMAYSNFCFVKNEQVLFVLRSICTIFAGQSLLSEQTLI